MRPARSTRPPDSPRPVGSIGSPPRRATAPQGGRFTAGGAEGVESEKQRGIRRDEQDGKRWCPGTLCVVVAPLTAPHPSPRPATSRGEGAGNAPPSPRVF